MVGIGTFLFSVALAVTPATVSERLNGPVPAADPPTEVFGVLDRVGRNIVVRAARRKTPTPTLPIVWKRTGRQAEKRIGVAPTRWAKVGPWGFGIENSVAHRE